MFQEGYVAARRRTLGYIEGGGGRGPGDTVSYRTWDD